MALGAERHATTRMLEGTRGSQHLPCLSRHPRTQACPWGPPGAQLLPPSPPGPLCPPGWGEGRRWAGPRSSRTVPVGAPALSRRWGQRRGWLRPAQQSSSFISSPAFLSLAPATLSPLRSSEESSEAPGTQVTRHAASVTHGTPSPAPESHAASGRASGQRDTPAPSLPWAELELDGMREPLALKSPPLQQPWAQGRCWRTEASRGGGSAQGMGDCQRTEVGGAGAKWRVG